MPKTIILSLGGSLIAPKNIDTNFLKQLKKTIGKFIKKSYRFVIVCGGGRIARELQQALKKTSKPKNEELDWLGIFATKANAQIVRMIFKEYAEDSIFDNPNKKINFRKNVLVASGWLPGWSTDYCAVLHAKKLGVKDIINMSNVDYVYDKDPRKHKNAKKLEKLSWKEYCKMISNKWKAGMNVPFDPVAAKEAKKLGMKVKIIGKNLRNLENLLEGKRFKGTVIG
ncbi:UMP kinase [Candidatus Woesearchaeota archaeon]|nr:UMP kinase [Candidatus Woesearchaeota archaeon]